MNSAVTDILIRNKNNLMLHLQPEDRLRELLRWVSVPVVYNGEVSALYCNLGNAIITGLLLFVPVVPTLLDLSLKMTEIPSVIYH